jgi:hypothetical protein
MKRSTVRREKRKSKPKTKTSAQLKQECYSAVQLLARIAAADDNGNCSCVTCGVTKHYTAMQGGHFIPKKKSSYWSLEIENVHPQCRGCNYYGMNTGGTAAQAYTLWMQDMYGRDFVDHMLETQGTIVKRCKADYEEILEELNKLIKKHKRRVI